MKSGLISKLRVVLVVGLVLSLGVPAIVQAATCDKAQSCSTHYQVNEAFFGSGGELNACSDKYCSKQAAGETAVGLAQGNGYQMQAGFNTTDVPLLEVIVDATEQDMGLLKPDRTGTATADIKIRSYLSSGYSLIITGKPLSMSAHTLATPSSPEPSQQGHEQFGLNLVKNTTPAVGADPVQVPDNSFSFGQVNFNYGLANQFMYKSGDIVAGSSKSTGQTNYTLSMIANVSPATAAGLYRGEYSAVVVPSY